MLYISPKKIVIYFYIFSSFFLCVWIQINKKLNKNQLTALLFCTLFSKWPFLQPWFYCLTWCCEENGCSIFYCYADKQVPYPSLLKQLLVKPGQYDKRNHSISSFYKCNYPVAFIFNFTRDLMCDCWERGICFPQKFKFNQNLFTSKCLHIFWKSLNIFSESKFKF